MKFIFIDGKACCFKSVNILKYLLGACNSWLPNRTNRSFWCNILIWQWYQACGCNCSMCDNRFFYSSWWGHEQMFALFSIIFNWRRQASFPIKKERKKPHNHTNTQSAFALHHFICSLKNWVYFPFSFATNKSQSLRCLLDLYNFSFFYLFFSLQSQHANQRTSRRKTLFFSSHINWCTDHYQRHSKTRFEYDAQLLMIAELRSILI